MIRRLQQLQRSYDESQKEVGSWDRKYRTEVSSLERKYGTEQKAHRETQIRLNSQVRAF